MEIIIKRLSPTILDDFLSYFDNTAFKDNPDWSFCYCHFNQFPHENKIWKNQTSVDNRNAVCSLINDSKMNGYIAYNDGKVVGWCNAGPRKDMTTMPEYVEPDVDKIGSIVCFIIEKKYRRKGIANRLLKEACVGFIKDGYHIIEGYPLKNVEGEKENHFGPLTLFTKNGFSHYREDEDTFVVRKYV